MAKFICSFVAVVTAWVRYN